MPRGDEKSTTEALVLPTEGQGVTPWPLYQQVKHMIVRRINSGHWQAGSKIPTENELVGTLGISRMTINRALRELTTEGVLTRKKGAGSFVAPQKPQFTLLQIRSIAEEIQEWGGDHQVRIISLDRIPADDHLLKSMQLEPDSTVFHSLLLHKDGDLPIQLAERFVNPLFAPDYLDQEFTRITPSEYLMTTAPIDEVEHVIETEIPNSIKRDYLQIQSDEPCLVLNRTTWIGDRIASRNQFTYPGTRYSLGGRFKASAVTGRLVV